MIRKNESAISLVEILASIVLTSIVLVLAFSIVVSSQKQNIEQTKESQQINDASYILKMITKDVRKTEKIVHSTSEIYEFIQYEANPIITYKYTANQLYRNGLLMATNIEDFKIEQIVKDVSFKVSFKLNQQSYEASLSFRRGSSK